MCTDYTDLNKNCPKDPYPLPNIDKLVDGASGHALLSLMDAYSGYNQIRMHSEDNPRRNMDVYVDDMVVKTLAGGAHETDLAEAFGELRKHNVRLNPEKLTDTAVSSVLIQEIEGRQNIIYFVSRALQGAEVRGAIKGHVLADFVAELTPATAPREGATWALSVDGSSNTAGSGAGVVLDGPGDIQIEQSLRFEFKATNNQAEYEALIAGLKLALDVGVNILAIRSDSQVVGKQVVGTYQVRDEQLARYLVIVKQLMTHFDKVDIEHVPREKNTRADVLAKLASTRRPENKKFVIQETLSGPSVDDESIMLIDEPPESWMDPIFKVLKDELDASTISRKLRHEASHYTLVAGQLYRRSHTHPMLACVPEDQIERIISEIHEGVCASHIGASSLAVKVLRAGFYWPTLRTDCKRYAKKCEKCQLFADFHKAPPAELTTMVALWPFAMWGVDLVGPFPEARSQTRFILVAVDYFTKWIEAEVLTSIGAAKIKSFYWRKLVCRFGIPSVIVSDNGTQFGRAGDPAEVLVGGASPDKWSGGIREQSNIERASLVYGEDAMIPVELSKDTWRVAIFNEEENEANLKASLDLLPEVREEAHLREAVVKQRAARRYNAKVVPRQIEEGDLVLR
ncbi:uncharacterized protein LOC130744612 [Lotus japonicus]|uniref:uncharacterized protein LOC130744612 n=1 Tax=Lotus japonicus TaxID=34305 RepID=UPI0025878C85|nr:uncharacterized protein LOC130744612 [Lotus japonicus]